MAVPSVIAIAAHPDDIEFTMAGTLCLLRQAGYGLHYLNVSSGSCGSMNYRPATIRRIRRCEARKAAAVLGARFHVSRADDFEILYTLALLRWLTGVIREVRPSIVLTHSPQDYMEDHASTSRLAVTAAFACGMPSFAAGRRAPIWSGGVVVYHAMPVGFCDPLRRRIVPEAFVDVSSVHATKAAALACHQSQESWLQATRGMGSLISDMTSRDRELGRMSRRFQLAEGWRRHAHSGLRRAEADPLRVALGRKYQLNRAYESRS